MNTLKGKRVLITGGAGFVGSHIADLLVKEEVKEIIILDNFVRGRESNLENAKKSQKLSIIKGDIRDKDLMAKIMRGVDYVLHQAAIRITQCANEPRECIETMVDGTFNILETSVKEKVKKIIVASSASVYGMADEFPTDEIHHPYNNRTLYGAAKLANEQMFRAFNEMYKLDYLALRYFNIYGPRMDIFGKYTEVMIRWLECIERAEPPIIFGDGSHSMDFIYVEDVAEANILALKSDASDKVINIASGQETTLLQLLNLLLKITNSNLKAIFKEERAVNPVKRRLASINLAKQLLNFQPKTSLEEGLKKLIQWRKQNIEENKIYDKESKN